MHFNKNEVFIYFQETYIQGKKTSGTHVNTWQHAGYWNYRCFFFSSFLPSEPKVLSVPDSQTLLSLYRFFSTLPPPTVEFLGK